MKTNSAKNAAPAGTVKRVICFITRYRLLLFVSILLATLTVAMTLYVPILVGRAIDLIVGEGNVDFPNIFVILIRVAVIVGIAAVSQWLMSMINNRITYHVVRDVRRAAFRKIEILPLKYIDSHAYGEVVSRVISDVDQFADGMLLGFAQLFTGVVTIVATLAFMISIDWRIALVVVILTPLSLFVARFVARKTHNMFKEQSETRAEQTALIDEMIGNQKVVQAFSHEGESLEKFDEVNDRLEECSVRATFFSSITNPVTRFINSIVYAAVGVTGALAAVSGSISVGGLASFLSYANQYTKPFNEISGVITELQNALVCAARIFELIDEEPEMPNSDNAVTLVDIEGNVKILDVEFSYVRERPLIREFNLMVKSGQKIAIVGPTGCGKTTLINLLMRFYDINHGSIRIDGEDIYSLTRASLRRSYGMVLQETWLKSGTVRENIIMGKPDATDAEVIGAAKAAQAHGFIKRLPNGYDTVLSDSGGSLSQGEKQLLCITRVMLCLPPMLILDEATSSIDTRTEIKIQEAFSRLMSGRTSFIVAHRLSTVREADIILVMREGNIVEQGRHDELLFKKGFYYELYNSQFAPS